ncbi:class I SAM-dependent methyltransferase [Patescibacteria group bacterium]|nr:class I SAM-dependent methyltransferase [Patescibacteria group bacterium]MBU1500832.1 class I SAM-dependent methyltransferase [Patescibacteria group bacterium]MBU2080887.1 class I SAM-dependent methyltransferase [Patescibacteria group bacterium]MBU2123992.1 class I SAM-dependent methyltransferase [Patescibacteria group bacterium]MBU2194717.1 class I SAM-dependent methyltransferase [Patescibacteria group bacterium]
MQHQEENPFTNAQVANEWISSVENEKGRTRDREVYPYLKIWASSLQVSNTVVEIGAGQGICAEKLESNAKYIGIEPSQILVERAKEKYSAPNRLFIVGDAYDVPLDDESAEAVFSINVLFHLENLKRSSEEMSRILKPQGKFLIVSANPSAYETWESFYENPQKEGKKLVGKVNIPVNSLSKNIMYQHSLEEIRSALQDAGLHVSLIKYMGAKLEELRDPIFIVIGGTKI